jgi:hypothetical protein
MIRRRVTADAGPTPEELDFLLACSRTIASVDRLHAAGRPYDPFFEFVADQMSAADFRVLFHRHQAVIVAEAKRRGIAVPDPSTYVPFPRGVWVVSEWDGD